MSRPILTIEIGSDKPPTEEDFIIFYFKDKDTNEEINRIYEKYMEVKGNFEKVKRPETYIQDTKTEPEKRQSSLGWQLIYENKPYSYTVDSQTVTLDINGKTYKDFLVNKEEYVTIFMITLEITMQKMAYDILKDNEDIIIPEITNHYLIDEDENYRIIIEMDYIKHKNLEKDKVKEAMNALDILRENNIYHFDTHKENIVQSVEGDKVVILDFGKAQITKTPDISSTTGLFKKHEDDDEIEFDYDKWINRTKPESQLIRSVVDFYGGKKTKSKRKTRKGKKKGKSKKTKKRTYRKRK